MFRPNKPSVSRRHFGRLYMQRHKERRRSHDEEEHTTAADERRRARPLFPGIRRKEGGRPPPASRPFSQSADYVVIEAADPPDGDAASINNNRRCKQLHPDAAVTEVSARYQCSNIVHRYQTAFLLPAGWLVKETHPDASSAGPRQHGTNHVL